MNKQDEIENYTEKINTMLTMRKAAKIHSIYYVYLIRVDNSKIIYYGVTCDFEKRKATHKRHVDNLINGKISVKPEPCFESPQNVHYAISEHLLKSKNKRSSFAMQFDICYQGKTLEEVLEVETFLIKMAKKSGKNCCNGRPRKKQLN